MTEDQENTWRALKDQDLLRTSFSCSLGFHTWTKWKEIGRVIKNGQYSFSIKTKLIELESHCVRCNNITSKILKFKTVK